MKINFKSTNNTSKIFRSRAGFFRREITLLGAAAISAMLGAQPTIAGNIFVIGMENHNLTQPNPTSSPEQILGNPAAPFLNSLMTPGNSNAVHTAYATAYHNSGLNVHPSEPNYVWDEAGSDFGFHSDADPSPANGNTFYDFVPHFTGQLNAAGIVWKDYQEDVQYSQSPTVSASGTTNIINPFNNSGQYNYAVKHNPMAFFADTALQNVYPIAQLFLDLSNTTTGAYNWITPNQFNDAHSALNGGFTYLGTHYTGDQAAVAQGDNFLATVVPAIMATPAYQNDGVIIIWWDETEGGDGTNFAIPETIISPLAKGNAYASTVLMSHSSDTKTMEEVFGLPFVNNKIPTGETSIDGVTYNHIATVNDLSDLFQPGAIPSYSVAVTRGGFVLDRRTQLFVQQVEITNTGTTPVPGPLYLVLDNLSANASLANATGTSSNLPPLGSPFIGVNLGVNNVLTNGESAAVDLEFVNPSRGGITYTTRVLPVIPAP